MADHLTKALNRALFHRHADFLLGHVPPMYSPVYHAIVGTFTDTNTTVEHFVPESCAAAARVHAPLLEDYAENPWLTIVLWHG